jgi:hypothetical protein
MGRRKKGRTGGLVEEKGRKRGGRRKKEGEKVGADRETDKPTILYTRYSISKNILTVDLEKF